MTPLHDVRGVSGVHTQLPRMLMAAPVAHTRSLQQVAQALHEAGALGALHTFGADNFPAAFPRALRSVVGAAFPRFDRRLRARRVHSVPDTLVHSHCAGEILRQLADRLGASASVLDSIWERSVFHLDRTSASMIQRPEFEGFLGVEHGSLFSLEAAAALGKPGVLLALSPHAASRRIWVDSEYERFPELFSTRPTQLAESQQRADERRNAEAAAARVIVTNSALTAETFIQAGFPKQKVLSLPLGVVEAITSLKQRASGDGVVRFVYAGAVAVHKGVHYLLQAWERLAANGAELHLYGRPSLPAEWLKQRRGVFLHGAVPYRELTQAYLRASVVVFPTLYDGFGEVVGEALANGVPVITTPRAGSADLIHDGRNGFIVPPADSETLAERMEWCLSHLARVEEMRWEAIETARKWTWPDYRRAARILLAQRLTN